ncbi:hypothetical protein [Mesorhizobium sp. Root102]|uniref:hypothetical protein n=1 Tax=Mesorhizobium sp. Root102 TaxID=1736422 RepID=UPI001FCDB903|nr:hypothetical protein [Mesorhizobium sp. Root102]
MPLISADLFQQFDAVRPILAGSVTELATKLVNVDNLRAIRRHCPELTPSGKQRRHRRLFKQESRLQILDLPPPRQRTDRDGWDAGGPFLWHLRIDPAGTLGID